MSWNIVIAAHDYETLHFPMSSASSEESYPEEEEEDFTTAITVLVVSLLVVATLIIVVCILRRKPAMETEDVEGQPRRTPKNGLVKYIGRYFNIGDSDAPVGAPVGPKSPRMVYGGIRSTEEAYNEADHGPAGDGIYTLNH